MTEPKRFYKVSEAAKRLSIGNTLMNKLIRDGEIDSVKIGSKCRRIPAGALDRYEIKISGGELAAN